MRQLLILCREEADTVARGVSLFFGGFCLLNLAGELFHSGFDANLWWIDLHWSPQVLSKTLLVISGALLLAHGLRPCLSRWRRRATFGCAMVLTIGAIIDSLQFYALLLRDAISTNLPVPCSGFFALGLGLVAWTLRRNSHMFLPTLSIWRGCAVCLALCFVFPLMQMCLFGKTDYRRPADVAVVPGARAYADGRASDALADRVRTACELYRSGTVSKLIFSGGPGDGEIHETEAMRRLAVSLGVNDADIAVDVGGLNTQRTVANTERIFAQLDAKRVIVVSHFYHLPRLKLAYHRAGREVWTVPAREAYLLRQIPFNMAREVAALWVYYFQPLTAA
jgi:vancomycin permeability regulator SanA